MEFAQRLKKAEVKKRLDIRSDETLRQLWKVRKVIPAPFQDAGGCCNYWLASDIDQYIKAQSESRKHPEAEAA